MVDICYFKGALKIASDNARIVPKEKVLIVSDYKMEHISKLIAIAAESCGGEVTVIFMSPRLWDCQEPPESVAQAMLASDVIFTPVSVSIAWTKAVINARKMGARILLMTGFTEELLASNALLKTDFDSCRDTCNKLADKYAVAKMVHLTSSGGTDFVFQIGGEKVNVVSSIVSKGELGSAPNIEINVVPLEGTANGTLVIDGSIPYLNIGVLEAPIMMKVRDGYIFEIDEQTKAAKTLVSNLKLFQNNDVFNVAEFGIGLNPNARLCGVMLEDEGVFGTIHIGIGTSIALGGKIDAPIHYDLIMKDIKIELDGVLVQSKRELFL